MLKTVLVYISLAVFSIPCNQTSAEQELPYYNTADFTPLFISKSVADTLVTHVVSDFKCKDQFNNVFTKDQVIGKIHVANFFFCSCGSVCPNMMSNLKKVNDVFAERGDIQFLSFSVTPWRDSVSVLKKYADEHQIKNINWHLLTGEKRTIYDLARKSYFAEEELGLSKDSSNFLHSEHILLVDHKGRIRGVYNGSLPLEMEQLISDIHQLSH